MLPPLRQRLMIRKSPICKPKCHCLSILIHSFSLDLIESAAVDICDLGTRAARRPRDPQAVSLKISSNMSSPSSKYTGNFNISLPNHSQSIVIYQHNINTMSLLFPFYWCPKAVQNILDIFQISPGNSSRGCVYC